MAKISFHRHFNRMKVICKGSQLREFYFKLIKSLQRKSLLSTELQTIIDVFTVVSLTQLFIHFKTVAQQLSFHSQALNWLNEMHNTSTSPAHYELLFGMASRWEGK